MVRQKRRTSRLDVGLVIAFAGIAFLVWALLAGVSRLMLQKMILTTAGMTDTLPAVTQNVKIFFVDTGFVIDLVGLAWMALSLTLIFFANWQKISISWAWLSAITQSLVAALGAMLVSSALYAPHIITGQADRTVLGKISQISLPIVLAIAILIWGLFVYWMLKRRASSMQQFGPSMTDSLRTNR